MEPSKKKCNFFDSRSKPGNVPIPAILIQMQGESTSTEYMVKPFLLLLRYQGDLPRRASAADRRGHHAMDENQGDWRRDLLGPLADPDAGLE